jgi:hypothetical protein
LHDRIVADHYFWPDRRKRTDLDISADSRASIHKSGSMNLRGSHDRSAYVSIAPFAHSG